FTFTLAAAPDLSTISLHDALPIFAGTQAPVDFDERLFVRVDRILLQRLADDRSHLVALGEKDVNAVDVLFLRHRDDARLERLVRSEEHTSELQSRGHLVCRLLLDK